MNVFRKIGLIGLLFVSPLMMFIHCLSKEGIFKNALYINPGNINDSLLPIVIETNDKKALKFEADLKRYGYDRINISEYLDIIFRYRDPALLPIYFAILESQNLHPYFKISAIYVIGEIGSTKNFKNLYKLWQSEKNDLIREYIASALGKLSDSSQASILKSMEKAEENAYVRRTLEAAISRANGGRRTRIAYLPLYDTVQFRRIKTYPSEKSYIEYSLIARKKIDTTISGYIPIAKDCTFPHMQYKKCRSIYEKVKQPFSSFALPGVWHVGEDSGWLFAGMPIHSIMDGRVALIQHEESWGCLVCIESMLPNKQIVCSYYGHLSSNLDVAVGQILKEGDKLGEIGPSFSLENGGYRSHLHLGIEKASIKNAVIAGYDENIAHWFNPVEFISNKKAFRN
jgi:murein DD-endopeptidase MepM/ murein hydrolase activator NlpD